MTTTVNWKPNEKQLKQFGWVSAIGFVVLSGVLGMKLGWFAEGIALAPKIMWGAGALSLLLSFVFPKGLVPLYLVMTALAFPIGFIIGNVILVLMFSVLFTPLALFFRARKRDELKLKLDPDANTYWEKVTAAKGMSSYFRQY